MYIWHINKLIGFLPTFGPTFVNFYGSPREFSAVSQSLDDLNAGKVSPKNLL